VHLPRLFRTSSFRLTLLYAGLFGASVLILFGIILWSSTGYVSRQIDATVSNEIDEVQAEAAGRGLARLRDVVAGLARHAPPGVYYLLEDASGRVLAGNMPALKPVPGIRVWTPDDATARMVPTHGIHGRGVRTEGGDFLFVGLDNIDLNEMQEMITRAFLWALAGMIVLALGGGVVMSLGLLRRVEAISMTSRGIVAGDLSRRIAVRGANDEFDHLAISLNAMLDRIQALMEGLSQVSSDIAHDLRTPLTRLRQRLELARHRGQTVPALHEALDRSIRDVDGILDTFGALLRIAQVEAHTKTAAFAELDLSAMLETVAELYQTVAEERGQDLAGEIAPGLRVHGDRELLPQLFSNLVENAVRHCPPGASIRLIAARTAEGIEVEIRDTGPGIPPELRERVFQRFFRLERSRTTSGTGLGLSLAAAIAGLHGARITLGDAKPGLRVQVAFPAGDGPRPAGRGAPIELVDTPE
jgi:signal transduction histidine kinase